MILVRKEVEFENIQGYDDLKDIVRRALDTRTRVLHRKLNQIGFFEI